MRTHHKHSFVPAARVAGARKRLTIRHAAVLLPTPLLLLQCGAASGSVNLTMTNGAATSATVVPGASFSFTVKLVSTSTAAADKVTGVDYYLTSQLVGAPVSNVFTIASRNTQSDGSAFSDVYSSDSTVITPGANPGLNPTNGTDLGGVQAVSGSAPVSNATVVVADYSLSTNAAAPSGVYKVLTFSTPG